MASTLEAKLMSAPVGMADMDTTDAPPPSTAAVKNTDAPPPSTAAVKTTDALPPSTAAVKTTYALPPTTNAKPTDAPTPVDQQQQQSSPPKKRKATKDNLPADQSDKSDGEELWQKSQAMIEANNPRAAVKLLCRAYSALCTDLHHAQRCADMLGAVIKSSDIADNRDTGFCAYHKSQKAEQEKEVGRIQKNIKVVEELLCLLNGAGYKDDENLVEGFKKRRT